MRKAGKVSYCLKFQSLLEASTLEATPGSGCVLMLSPLAMKILFICFYQYIVGLAKLLSMAPLLFNRTFKELDKKIKLNSKKKDMLTSKKQL